MPTTARVGAPVSGQGIQGRHAGCVSNLGFGHVLLTTPTSARKPETPIWRLQHLTPLSSELTGLTIVTDTVPDGQTGEESGLLTIIMHQETQKLRRGYEQKR